MNKNKNEPKRYTRASGLISKQVTINGKRKVFYGHNEKEITQKMLEYKGEVQAGPMFETVADEWWAQKEKEIRAGSVKSYKPAKARAVEAFRERRIKEIDASDISRMLLDMKAKGSAQKTVSNQHCVLTMIFEYWCSTIGGNRNPSMLVRTPSGCGKTVRKPPCDAQMQAVRHSIETAKSIDDGITIAALALYTGCRRGELLALKRSDIEDGTISIRRSVEHAGNYPIVGDTKTESGVRTIPVLAGLKKYLNLLPNSESDFYIVGLGTSPITQTQYNNRWIGFCKDCGIAHSTVRPKKRANGCYINETVWHPDVTAHQFRHAFATEMYNAKIPMEIAMRIMGHADSEMIRRVYLDINKNMLSEAGKQLEKYEETHTSHTHDIV